MKALSTPTRRGAACLAVLAGCLPLPLFAQNMTTVELDLPPNPYPCQGDDCHYSESPYVSTLYDGGYARGETGWSIIAGVDLDRDGFQDVVIGAPGANSEAGAIHVVYGAAKVLYGSQQLASTATVVGGSYQARFGNAIAAGDLTADGSPDLAIGAPGSVMGELGDRFAGTVYIVPGGERWEGETAVQSLPGAFNIPGDLPNGEFGRAVAVADITGDGISDLVVGAPGEDTCFVFAGPLVAGEELQPFSVALEPLSRAGSSVAIVGDLNRNGYIDFAVGAPEGMDSGGMIYFLDGQQVAAATASARARTMNVAPSPLLARSSLQAGEDVSVVIGDLVSAEGEPTGSLGTAIAGIGDINGDQFPDMALGAPSAPTGDSNARDLPGRVYLLGGSETFFGQEVFLSTLSVFFYCQTDQARLGASVHTAGDVDRDGTLDLLIGAPGKVGSPVGGVSDNGSAYLVLSIGQKLLSGGSVIGDYDGFHFVGTQTGSDTGTTVFGAMGLDFDDDGFGEILIGAPGAAIDPSFDEGFTYLVSMGDFFDRDGDGQPRTLGDCQDRDPEIFFDPDGGTETCDGKDNDCDGRTDDEDFPVSGQYTYYWDRDDDGFGDPDAIALTTCSPNPPKETSSSAGDCDDTNREVNPRAPERCDGIDNDCDSLVDDEDPDIQGNFVFYLDADNDGHGTAALTISSCQSDVPDGFSIAGDDCDDSNPEVFPGAPEGPGTDPALDCLAGDGIDNDCDPETPPDLGTCEYDDDDDGFSEREGDCNDGDPGISPGAEEICDDVDQDCDGNSTNGFDIDGDGFIDEARCAQYCEAVACQGCELVACDCDDNNPEIYPGAFETCDGLDNNCTDGTDDERQDFDGDTFFACQNEDPSAEDCDDTNDTVHPGAEEVCDGIDNDCDGIPPEEQGEVDEDHDGVMACNGDCDDTNDTVHPGAEEVCDGTDNDCDGEIDNGAAGMQTVYTDADGDGFGDSATGMTSCQVESGQAIEGGDCDDANPDAYPGADEVCNGVDDNCDSIADETEPSFDQDGDGALDAGQCAGYTGTAPLDCDDADPGVHPGADEIAGDGIDNDCDGSLWEGAPGLLVDEGAGCACNTSSPSKRSGTGSVLSLAALVLGSRRWRRRTSSSTRP